ncbi:MAG: hypothetical protein R2710_28685 [Acidimicrobiales bacterium]
MGHARTGDIVAVLGGSTATIGATDTLRMVRCPDPSALLMGPRRG